MDKASWNEAWMGKIGPHYAENSNYTAAQKLAGKLLLAHGEVDENVPIAATLKLVEALLQANKVSNGFVESVGTLLAHHQSCS